MKTSPFRPLVTFGMCVLAFVAGIFVGKATPTSPAKSVSNADLVKLEPQIQDATRRWSLKNRESEQSVRESYEPRSMFIPTRNQSQGMVCIELALKPGGVGGSPVYCYQDDFLKPQENIKLVAEYSDVE